MNENQKRPDSFRRLSECAPGVARWIGKAFLAAGFLLGIYGLTEESPVVMRAGLGLLAAGIAAMSYALFLALVARSHQPDK